MGFEIDSKRGVTTHYGPRNQNGKFGGQQNYEIGVVKSAIWDFSYDDLPSYGTGGLEFVIPAGASIVSARLVVDVAFTSTSGTTDLEVGLYTKAGVEIDGNGLIAATEATQTAIGTSGNIVTGAGALIGKAIGAAAGELKVTPTVADLTAGKGRVIVEFIYDKN